MTSQDQQIITCLKKGQEKGIKLLFEHHFASLCVVAQRIVHNQEAAKDIVQDVFVRLWTHRKKLHIQSSLYAYLKRSVVNASIDHQRRYYEKNKVSLDTLEDAESDTDSIDLSIEGQETKELINEAVSNLPDRCRLVFVLSRYESYPYRKIAEELGISIKTVENQMTKALRILREKLSSVKGT